MKLKYVEHRDDVVIENCYKIMDYEHRKGPKTLFHGNMGSRIVLMHQWHSCNERMVRDGTSKTWYLSGWHSFRSFEEAKEYLKAFKNLEDKIIVRCHILGNIRPKAHSRANVLLSQMILLDKVVWFYDKKWNYLLEKL